MTVRLIHSMISENQYRVAVSYSAGQNLEYVMKPPLIALGLLSK